MVSVCMFPKSMSLKEKENGFQEFQIPQWHLIIIP